MMHAMTLLLALAACGPYNDERWCQSHPEECDDVAVADSDSTASPTAGDGCGGPPEAEAACRVVLDHCYECHGAGGRAEGGFNYSRDVQRMVQTGKVIPFDPVRSRVHERIAGGTMPPVDEPVRPTAAELATIERWIAAGAPDWDPDDDCAARNFRTPSEEVELVLTDLLTLDGEISQNNTRYLTLTHLWNSCVSDDELETYRYGLSKLVNSLSHGGDPVLPRPIDPERLMFAVDLRDLRWDVRNVNGVDAWEHLVKRSPYALSRVNSANVRDLTNSRLPILPADWFVFAAARPPLYNEILRLPDDGNSFLFDLFDVDRIANLQSADVVRAGFEGSGVSANNRMIERHAGSNGVGSYCWVSYDFATDVESGNVLSHPLHPADPVGTCPQAPAHTFAHAGGELICSLPNGLQAYYLETETGAPLDVGPIEIVEDFEGPEAPFVMNGVSCMFCHAQGIIEKADDVANHWAEHFGDPDFAALFPECVNDTVNLTYRADEALAAMAADRERFISAMELAGVPREQVTEPIAILSNVFSEDMTALRVAAELGLDHRGDSPATPSRFRQCLDTMEATNPALALELSPLLSNLTVSREIFEKVAGEFICACEFIERDDFVCRLPVGGPNSEDACGPAGLACLDDQTCIVSDPNPTDRINDVGACVGA